jgi:hypothetical protein
MQSTIGTPYHLVVSEGAVSGLHTAVVYAADGVRLVATAASHPALTRRIADYVQKHASDRLWPRDAYLVHQALADAAHEVAVELYFAFVGQRWDEEWIVLGDPSAA